MLRMVKNKKNQDKALVDIRKSAGPTPIYFAIDEVFFTQHLAIGSIPSS